MKVEVLFYKNSDKLLFRITTDETILTLTEAETKKLYRELQRAFRPISGAKHAKTSKDGCTDLVEALPVHQEQRKP